MPITNTLSVLGAILAQEEERKKMEMAQSQTVAGKPPSAMAPSGPLAAMEAKYGPGEVAGTEGTMRSFTSPTGFTRTMTQGGSQFSLQIPTHYTNDYSPYDQKKIEKLYKDRSEIATDAELDRDEDARQAALDNIDSQISRVPRLSPRMREPSPQEQFNSTIVTAPDGRQGYWDGKKFTAFDDDASQEAYQKDFQIAVSKRLQAESKLENPASTEQIIREERAAMEVRYGRRQLPEPGQGIRPDLKDEWDGVLSRMRPHWYRLDEPKTVDAMNRQRAQYVAAAVEKGVDPQVASVDFMIRWKEAMTGATVGRDFLPEMTAEMKNEATYGYLDLLPGAQASQMNQQQGPDMFAAGPMGDVPRGGGIVQGEGGTTTIAPAPKGLEAIWSGLDEEDRQAVNQAMQQGYTSRQILDTYKKAVGAK